jgi:uncharacterized membrane protein YhaH (DUF805 family)
MKDVVRLFRQGFDFKSETGSKDVIRWFAFLIITSIIFIGALFVLFFIINGTDLNSSGVFNGIFSVTLILLLFVFLVISLIPSVSLCIRRLKAIKLSPFLIAVPILAVFAIVRMGLIVGFANMNGENLPISDVSIDIIFGVSIVLILLFFMLLLKNKAVQ